MINRGITIAVSGKGGVGKTMFSTLLIRCLSRRGSVLAIDADPDTNLPQALGIATEKTVGGVREAIINAPARSSIAADKLGAFERALNQIMEETEDFDLIVMGRSEGEGCYCAINTILRQIIDAKANNYDFTVVDCEPGLEHLSRRTTRDVDLMIVVTEPTVNGVLTAKRVQELSKELDINFGEVLVVANKVTPETRPLLDSLAEQHGLKLIGYIPYDPEIARFDTQGKPIIELPEDSPASIAASEVCEQILGCAVS